MEHHAEPGLSRIEELLADWWVCRDAMVSTQLADAQDALQAADIREAARAHMNRIVSALSGEVPQGADQAWNQLLALTDTASSARDANEAQAAADALRRAARVIVDAVPAPDAPAVTAAMSASSEGASAATLSVAGRSTSAAAETVHRQARRALALAILELPEAMALHDRLRAVALESDRLRSHR